MQVIDVVTPEIFTPYVQQLTEEKARLVQSGVMARNAMLDEKLAGGGLTFNVPSWQDLDNDTDNVSTDSVAGSVQAASGAPYDFNSTFSDTEFETALDVWGDDSTPNKIGSGTEVAVRLSRNNSWSSSDLSAALAGEDPMDSIASRVAYYWTRRLQAAFIATIQGISRDNSDANGGDYAWDISDGTGGTFTDGVTNFSAEAFLDATVTMGDSMEDLTAIMVHSVVYNRMQKNNLIDFIPDARGEIMIPTFLGREVIVDDGLPNGTNATFDDGATGESGVYESWLFGAGAAQMGVSTPKVATEVERHASSGNGGGSETLYNRVEWSIHPVGHAYNASSVASGGPDNTNSANNLNHEDSWERVYPERKQIKFARLITRES